MPKVPSIATNRQLSAVLDDAIMALFEANDPPVIFRRGNTLVRTTDEGDGPEIETLSIHAILERLARVARWVVRRKESAVDVYPPREVAETVSASPDLPLPRLSSVVRTPFIVPNCKIISKPGYYSEYEVMLYMPYDFNMPDVPDKPTANDLACARSLILDELLVNFPFTDEGSRANAVAMILLPFARQLIDGPTPLHLVEAPNAGTGKSLLVSTAGVIAGEDRPAIMTEKAGWRGEPDEAEWRKSITSALKRGRQFIRIDNIRHGLDSAALSAALTCRTWVERELGYTRELELPVTCVWTATGNNITLSREVARRTVITRLDAKVPQPEDRQDFLHPLPAWAAQNRGALVGACLTMIRAAIVDGLTPDLSVPMLGSYEVWTSVMSSILKSAGISGFLGNRGGIYDHIDEGTAAWFSFVLDVWWGVHGSAPVLSRELFELADRVGLIEDLIGKAKGSSAKVKFGLALRKRLGQIVGNVHVEGGEPDHHGQPSYRLAIVKNGNVSAGVDPTPAQPLHQPLHPFTPTDATGSGEAQGLQGSTTPAHTHAPTHEVCIVNPCTPANGHVDVVPQCVEVFAGVAQGFTNPCADPDDYDEQERAAIQADR